MMHRRLQTLRFCNMNEQDQIKTNLMYTKSVFIYQISVIKLVNSDMMIYLIFSYYSIWCQVIILLFYFQKHIITWDQLLEIGMDLPEHKLFERLRRVAINQCCSILYTSGTDSGPVKGVMLSHDNLTWSSKMVEIHGWFIRMD